MPETSKNIPIHTGKSYRFEVKNGRVAALRRRFRARVAALARTSPDALARSLALIFGPKMSPAALDAVLEQARQEEFPLPPKAELVPRDVLHGHHGAYAAIDGGTAFLDEGLADDELDLTFAEEVGHHLDRELGGADTIGDEGEALRAVLEEGGALPPERLALARADRDQATITWQGKPVEVELREKEAWPEYPWKRHLFVFSRDKEVDVAGFTKRVMGVWHLQAEDMLKRARSRRNATDPDSFEKWCISEFNARGVLDRVTGEIWRDIASASVNLGGKGPSGKFNRARPGKDALKKGIKKGLKKATDKQGEGNDWTRYTLYAPDQELSLHFMLDERGMAAMYNGRIVVSTDAELPALLIEPLFASGEGESSGWAAVRNDKDEVARALFIYRYVGLWPFYLIHRKIQEHQHSFAAQLVPAVCVRHSLKPRWFAMMRDRYLPIYEALRSMDVSAMRARLGALVQRVYDQYRPPDPGVQMQF